MSAKWLEYATKHLWIWRPLIKLERFHGIVPPDAKTVGPLVFVEWSRVTDGFWWRPKVHCGPKSMEVINGSDVRLWGGQFIYGSLWNLSMMINDAAPAKIELWFFRKSTDFTSLIWKAHHFWIMFRNQSIVLSLPWENIGLLQLGLASVAKVVLSSGQEGQGMAPVPWPSADRCVEWNCEQHWTAKCIEI